MSNKLKIIGICILIILGIGLMTFPIISNLFADKNHSEVIATYQAEVNELPNAEIEDAWAAAISYNEQLHQIVSKENPFSTEFTFQNESYEELLNVDQDGVMCYIRIPKIDVYLPVYHGTSDEVLAKGAGHLLNSSLPVGGESTHTVISAHTAFPGAKMFDELDQLVEGDVFYLYTLDKVLAYQVDQIKTVLPYETDDFRIVEGSDYATLVTCTPYGVNSHRLLVRGARISYEDSDVEIVSTPEEETESIDAIAYFALIPILILFIVLSVLLLHSKKGSE